MGGGGDPSAGDLSYANTPWLAWAAYLWAGGPNPRSDGLKWLPTDYLGDYTHPSPAGVNKVSGRLMSFFKTSPKTRCWFVTGATCS